MEDKKSLYADLSLLIVAIIWGSGFVVTKNALDHVLPYYLLSFRFIISFLLMALVFFKRFKNMKLEDFKAGFIIGLFIFRLCHPNSRIKLHNSRETSIYYSY